MILYFSITTVVKPLRQQKAAVFFCFNPLYIFESLKFLLIFLPPGQHYSIFVGDLDNDITDDDLRKAFQVCGDVV